MEIEHRWIMLCARYTKS